MKKNVFKRILATVLALSVILPGGSLTVRAESAPDQASDQDYAVKRAQSLAREHQTKGMELPEVKETDPNETVRVIIEFETEPDRVAKAKGGLSTLSRIGREQEAFFRQVNQSGMKFKKLHTFRHVFNGTSAMVQRKDISRLEKLSGVSHVAISQEYQRPEPLMAESGKTVDAPFAWNLGYTGEGLVVGIIDSGFDTTHKDFKLTVPENGKLKPQHLVGKNLPGKYINEKFPYGFNYYDQNDILLEAGVSHGQHVAGTVAANGTVKGIAPEAQLLALRVFSNDPLMSTTFDDIYIKAIDDGVTLGADALNLSLGSPAAFTPWTETSLDRAVANARNSGVMVAIAAGNDRNSVYGHKDTRHTENGEKMPRTAASWMPDQGVMSSPALTPESLAVAACEKTPHVWDEISLSVELPTGPAKRDILPAASSPNPVEVLGGKELEYVSVVYGYPQDYEKVDVQGKIALVMRGELMFTEKLANAEAAGAAAILIYDNTYGDMLNMPGGESAKIPYMFTDIATGQLLENMPEGSRKLSFQGVKAQNPSTLMADFSTWGSTNDLRLKPEITAPGSNINSLQNGNEYGVMSGTSMATPHVAGGTAVVKDYLNHSKTFEKLTEMEKISLAKVLMMNTADILFEGNAARSPRVQGAGMMNLKRTIETTALITNPKTGEAKIELKEVRKPAFGLNLAVRNFGSTSATYQTQVILLTDEINAKGDYTELSRNVKFKLTGGEPLTVDAGTEKPLNLYVDFSEDSISTEQFIEGFVILTDEAGNKSSVPFMGFYGDWNKPYLLDNFISNDEVGQDPYGVPYFNYSALLGSYLMEIAPGFFFPQYKLHRNTGLALNPGTEVAKLTGNGIIVPHLSFVRSAETFSFSILDESKTKIFNIGTMKNVAKVNSIYRGAPSARTFGQGTWEGNLRDGMIPEGKYFYEMRGRINYEDAQDQVKLVPFIIDYSAPIVKNIKLDGNFLNFEATDGPTDRSAGVREFVVSTSKAKADSDLRVTPTENNEYRVDVSSLLGDEVSELYIFSFDTLYNSAMTTVDVKAPPVEENRPVIFMYSPEQVSRTTDVTVQGYVFGIQQLDRIELITEDKTIPYEAEYVENETIPNPSDPWGEPIYEGPVWVIDAVVPMKAGRSSLKVLARAKDGTENSLIRWVYVDDGAPVLDVKVIDRDKNSETATFEITMRDALPALRLMLNKEEIFNYDGFDESIEEVVRTMEHEVPLKVGANEFSFALTDALGNLTEHSVTIERSESVERVKRIAGDTRYQTAIEVSQSAFQSSNWVVVVSGESATDSLLAGPLAVRLKAPILLAGKSGLNNELVNEIKRLGAINAVIVGGNLAVSEDIATGLKDLGLRTERLGGKDRFETSVLVDAKVRAISRVYDKAVIANAYTVFDALSMGASAGKMGVGILLNDGNTLNSIETALAKVQTVILLGGEKVETKAVEDLLAKRNIKVDRVCGETRYATATAIAKRFYTAPKAVILSNGVKPFDALAGTALAARYDAALLITPADELHNSVREYLDLTNPDAVYLLGGEQAIQEIVRSEVEKVLK